MLEKNEIKSLHSDAILIVPKNPSLCQLSFPDQIRNAKIIYKNVKTLIETY